MRKRSEKDNVAHSRLKKIRVRIQNEQIFDELLLSATEFQRIFFSFLSSNELNDITLQEKWNELFLFPSSSLTFFRLE